MTPHKNQRIKQRAVCMFPLQVAVASSDMRFLLNNIERRGVATLAEETRLAELEAEIRETYRQLFGTEMG